MTCKDCIYATQPSTTMRCRNHGIIMMANAVVCNEFKSKPQTDAADAIEELQEDNAALNGTVSNLIQQIEELSKPRWIPVTERLPVGGDDSGAICENVCLLMDDGTVSCGWMNGITKKVYYLNARDDVVIKAPITRVTHWMPLPKPPKEEEEQCES